MHAEFGFALKDYLVRGAILGTFYQFGIESFLLIETLRLCSVIAGKLELVVPLELDTNFFWRGI